MTAHATSEAQSSSPTPSPGVSTTSINISNDRTQIKKSETFGSFEQRMRQPPVPLGNVKRAISMQSNIKAISHSSVLDTDNLPGKPRRQSQLLSVLQRTKTMGSTEDLTSLSSATSSTSLTSVSTAAAQVRQ